MNSPKTTRTLSIDGNITHLYHGFHIELNDTISAGYFGRYRFRHSGKSHGASSLKHAKKLIDVIKQIKDNQNESI